MTAKAKLLTKPQADRIRTKISDDPQGALADLRATIATKRILHSASKLSIDAIARTSRRKRPETSTGTLDQEFGGEWDRVSLIATSRQLFQNFSLATMLRRQHLKNVVGTGPRLQSQSGDDDFDKRREAAFKEWSASVNVRGTLSLAQFLRVGESSEITDGDFAIGLIKGRRLQGIEGDKIADPPKDKRVRGRLYSWGVEMNREGVPLAYHIHKRGKNKGRTTYSRRLEADDAIFCTDQERFDQVRGWPWLSSAITDSSDLKAVLDAVRGKLQIENMLSAFTKSEPTSSDLAGIWGDLSRFDATAADGTDEDRYEVRLGEGIHSFNLRPGEDAGIIESKTPSQNFEQYLLFMIRIIAGTLRMPLEIALQYFTRGSYSAHRASFLQYRDFVIMRRKDIETSRLDRSLRWWTDSAIKAGILLPPKKEFHTTRHRHVWQWPGFVLLDPDRERRAQATAYNIGSSSLSSICAESGDDWEEVADQRIREVKKITDKCVDAGVNPADVLPKIASPGTEGMLTGTEDDDNDGGDNDD